MKNPLVALQDFGQSVWYDNISRHLLLSGEMARLIAEDGVLGVTSNPTILQTAISSGDLYDADIARLAGEGKTVAEIYEALVVSDIQAAADLLRPVYERTDGVDGYVSLEVSPHLAHDTRGTVDEAKRLFARLDRPNVMIKVPATPEGIPAIAELIGAGLNINVTLIFAIDAYEAVARAYIEGLDTLDQRAGDLRRAASVASFFVSRMDTAVDAKLEGRPEMTAFRGRAGIANAKLAYRRFQEVFAGPHWVDLTARGARVQRPLWASTSTKMNPSYPDTMYTDALIGPHTVDTMPPVAFDACRDHGRAALTVTEGVGESEQVLAALAQADIDMEAVTAELLEAGLRTFANSFDRLMGDLAAKLDILVSG